MWNNKLKAITFSYDDAVTQAELLSVGIEIILLAAVFKADADDLYHGYISLSAPGGRWVLSDK